jgi:PAS domain S-box-containing protein
MMPKDQPIRILIIDDDDEDFYITSNLIKNISGYEFKIDWCYDYDQAIELIVDERYDVYFVDFLLGARTGLELIQEAASRQCENPIVLLTGHGNRVIDIKAMEAGASDYLVKPDLTVEKIERCIRYALGRFYTLKALRANEQKYRNIFERSRDVVFIADEHLFFKDINEAVTEVLGYEGQNLIAKNLCDILANDKDKITIRQELSMQGDVDDKEVEILTSKGERKYCVLSLSGETDMSGDSYVQGIIHDITSLKKSEKATIQLEKLGVAGRLIRTLAHEVRNPLNNINLATAQIKKDIPANSIPFMEIIQRNSQRIGDIISELLYSSGPADVKQNKTSLQDIIKESIDAANDRLTLKKIKLKTLTPEEPASIMADAGKLKIALLNIIINAIEAMTESNGELIIEVKKANKNMVIISDNGSGISEENLSRLFEPYFTSKRNGLGLGLATTLNILQSHKATVEVQSRLHKGTTFVVSFLPA